LRHVVTSKLDNHKNATMSKKHSNLWNPFNLFIDYYRCQKALDAKGVDTAPCDWYKRVYKSLCPLSWIEKWDTQREDGTFPGKI
uniref:Cytochrome c oxidase subunit 6B1 n=1 Tax=Sinocyclocheilus grahami TaxID=75366 RepID=A0A672MRK5_SINGR